MTRPAHEGGHTVRTFPIRVLLAAEQRGARIWPGIVVWSVVGRIEHARVVSYAHIIQLLEHQADVGIVFDHSVTVFVLPRLAPVLCLDVRAEMHARGVPPAEEGFPGFHLAIDEVQRSRGGLIVDRLHPLLGERTSVRDRAPGRCLDDTARTEFFEEFWILWIIQVLRLLRRIEVVKAAKVLIEAVRDGQVFVTVTEMILAELPSCIAPVLKQCRDRRIARLPTLLGTG